ncbi:PREDICTED: probable LRR receptor-like serine/threonine-protein kinase At1g14390 isoform X2 [Lupinus angustifolius]|uniref:probable LRR receptor-like serine/threonine-protein kinase At1g14390 isoform X2 n=1 Tax=Lupinus angustifolius TaxID=3871 RepID=UPI00092E6B18|nr:PREDICTED: probable LRR receptor-like serine/threonine-protein kinase At1g14390 isoform X2 [Lupinus angustifolius]
MKNFLVSLFYLFPPIIAIILLLLTPIPNAQLTSSENRILLQIQKLLEYPQVLEGWTNMTNFCYLPPSLSLKIVCSNGHVIELTIIGNKGSPFSRRTEQTFRNLNETLSKRFSIHSFFTVLTKLSNLKVLSLVSIGLWGHLPSKINRFASLEVMNISSNFINGEIPSSISSMKSLKSLVLADNQFNGIVLDLTGLASLEELNLSGNKFGPEFPSTAKKLMRINLRNNSLRCQIPPQLMQVDKLQQLDISSNEVFGNIPSFLFSLPFLQYLNLAANHLSGSLSLNISCSSALTFVDISNNFLLGKLPPCIGSKSSKRTVLYSGNCLSARRSNDQFPSSYCKKGAALAVKPPLGSQKDESKMQLGLVLGITGGAVGITVFLASLILFIFRKSRSERTDNNVDRHVSDKVSITAYPRPNVETGHVPQTILEFPPYSIFTSEEIEDATNNFHPSNLIEGSQGKLYKAWLRDGSMVLVHRVKLKQPLLKNIMQNLKVLSNLRHRHLVSIVGHCVVTYQGHPQTASTIFIVFEHVSNVSLKDHLTNRRKKELLKWPQRMTISIGIARGIQFLHKGIAPGIFGNNLKIENILLDGSLNAKVSGYSIPLPSKLEKGLLEATSPMLMSATDPNIEGTYAYESMKTAVQITINCISKNSSNHPSIEDIIWNLQYSMQAQGSRTSSGNPSPNL